jgi:DNA-binding transcriptional ArsR family regulator
MNSETHESYSEQLEGFWTDELLKPGFVAVPTLLLEYREYLHLNTTEFTVLLALLSFRHNNRPIYPSIRKISERSGVEARVVYRATSAMEKHGLIYKESRPGRTTNYDLSGLVDELRVIDRHVRIVN